MKNQNNLRISLTFTLAVLFIASCMDPVLDKDENYETSLKNLAESKLIIYDFFDNVMVNDKDKAIKKNRLELLSMLCKTFDNYINFSNIETS